MITEKEKILNSCEAKIEQIQILTQEVMTLIWNGDIEEAAEKAIYNPMTSEEIRKLKK